MGHIAHGALDAHAQAPKAPRGEAHDDAHQRRDHGEGERQHGVLQQKKSEEHHHLQAVRHQHLERIRGGVAQLRGGERQPRYQVALGAAVVERARQIQQAVEQLRANHMNSREGNARQRVVAQHRAEGPGQRQRQHQRREHPQIGRHRIGQAVDHQPEGPSETRLAAGGEQEPARGEHEPRLLIAHVAEQPLVDGPIAAARRLALGRVSRHGVVHRQAGA